MVNARDLPKETTVSEDTAPEAETSPETETVTVKEDAEQPGKAPAPEAVCQVVPNFDLGICGAPATGVNSAGVPIGGCEVCTE